MFNKLVNWLFFQSRLVKQITYITLDIIFITVTFWLAFFLKFDSYVVLSSATHWLALGLLLASGLIIFSTLGLYQTFLRYVDFNTFAIISVGITIPTLVLIACIELFQINIAITMLIIYNGWAIFLCSNTRLAMKSMYAQSTDLNKEKIIIYGAGEAGRQLASSIQPGLDYKVVAFIDDDTNLQNIVLHGVRVHAPSSLPTLQEKYQVNKLLLAMPCLSPNQKRNVINALPDVAIEILSMPGLADIVSGKARMEDLKEVSIDDLLGRDKVEPIQHLMDKNVFNKTVLVTGAGGSIGSELCRQILALEPKQLILLDNSEFALYKIEQELKLTATNTKVVPILGSVTNLNRIESILETYQVQTVFHAAAYKHVPLVEWNTVEGINNNTFGTMYTAQAAIKAKVETFVLISTDKAVRPTNVMGASKRLAELVCQALSETQNITKFCMVRFGNVLGSSGSVIPLLKKQVTMGGPVTVTHKDITRYFMAIPEAAQLVIQASAMATGGDVFVLDMGEPIKIYDLAKKLIRLMGLQIKNNIHPDGDIEIKITGLRPGEKLFEELLINNDDNPTEHPRICTTHEENMTWPNLHALLNKLFIACNENNQSQIRKLLCEAPLAYSPDKTTHDLLWQQQSHKLEEVS